MQTLLNHGADPNITPSPTHWTALHYACQNKKYGINKLREQFNLIELLMKFKANVSCQDINGYTPLDVLLSKLDYKSNDHEEYIHCIRLLLDHHANVHMHGLACLCNAIQYGKREQTNFDILRLLLNSKNILDVNVQFVRPYSVYINNATRCVYIKGDTILNCAVRMMNVEVVQMILEYSTPNLCIRNSANETSYDIAQRVHHKPIMECLRMTLVLQCHVFLRQKWIQMKQSKDDYVKATII